MIADSQDSMNDPLVTYLGDHKAGSGLAIGLLQAMEGRYDDESLSQFARSILTDIEEDEETLRNFAKEISTGSNVLKKAAAWLGEKASRVKLGAGSSGFRTFEALDSSRSESKGSSASGMPCKSWAVSDARLRSLDFDTPIARLKRNMRRWSRLALAQRR
jgi:hypothetical protein